MKIVAVVYPSARHGGGGTTAPVAEMEMRKSWGFECAVGGDSIWLSIHDEIRKDWNVLFERYYHGRWTTKENP